MLLTLSFLLALAVPVVSPAADWPTFQGGATHLGTAPNLSPPLTVAWTVDLRTAVYSSPVIAGGMVFVAGENGEISSLTVAGAPVWKTRIKGKIYASTPCVADGVMYIGSVAANGSKTGNLWAISAATGSVVWSFAPERARNRSTDIYSSPLLVDNLVIFGCDDRFVYALNRATGKIEWKFEAGDMIHDNSATLAGDLVLIGSFDGFMYALKLKDGSLAWKFKTRKKVNTAPAVIDGRAYFGAEDGNLYALSLADGKLLWSWKTRAAVVASPVITADSIYLASTDGTVTALSRDGVKKWVFNVGSHVISAPLAAGAHIYTCAIDTLAMLDQTLYSLDAMTGKVEWKFQLRGPLFASPAYSDGLLVIAGKKGRLYGFKSSTGPG